MFDVLLKMFNIFHFGTDSDASINQQLLQASLPELSSY